MKVIISYPLAFDAWETFAPFAARFCETFKKFGPGHSHYEVWAMCTFGEPTDAEKLLFRGIKTQFVPYHAHGCDIGAAQKAGANCGSKDLVLAMTSRCYFHRYGWLKRYVETRETFGPGLYSASTSWEGGKPHCCTRAYMMDSDLWQRYPLIVSSREEGQKFETGDWCVTSWARKYQLRTGQVRWDGADELMDSRRPELGGIFRRGEQNEVLVWDRHTDVYAEADASEKRRLEEMANPPNN